MGRPKSDKPKKKNESLRLDEEMKKDLDAELALDPEETKSSVMRKALRQYLAARKAERAARVKGK